MNNAAILIRGEGNRHLLIQDHIQPNFYGVKNMIEAFLPLLEPAGHIVNISGKLAKTEFLKNPTLAARFLNPDITMEELMEIAREYEGLGPDWEEKGWNLNDTGAYTVSKALADAYSRILARKLKEKGSNVRINSLNPGWVKTEMGTNQAFLTLEEGAVVPFRVVTDTSDISGNFWENNYCGVYT